MRMLIRVSILVVALAVTGTPAVARGASDPATAEPSFAELLARAQQNMGTDEGTAYDKVMGRQFESKYTDTVARCVRVAGTPEPEPFQAVIVVEQDGTVSKVVLDPETEVAKCIRRALLQETFPEPPFAPFHDLLRLSFE
ncbi:MAG: hypothetical protein ACHQ7N_13375 [Candidatus Methylomirabilales bacterium]